MALIGGLAWLLQALHTANGAAFLSAAVPGEWTPLHTHVTARHRTHGLVSHITRLLSHLGHPCHGRRQDNPEAPCHKGEGDKAKEEGRETEREGRWGCHRNVVKWETRQYVEEE